MLIRNTDLIGIWTASLIENDPVPGDFLSLPVSLPIPAGNVGISRRASGILPPAAEALIHQLRSLSRDSMVSIEAVSEPPASR
jgi:hypothetical protein